MKTKLLTFAFCLLPFALAEAQTNQHTWELPLGSSVAGTDNFLGIASPGTAPVSKRYPISALGTYLADATLTLTGKTISGASNTLSNIANASLTNSAITVAGTSVSLGGTITASAILDAISSTQGAVLYRGASGWSALAPGTSGYYLQAQGAGANPQWAALTASGTVTTVSVTTANGVSGTVANATTTPAITLSLGAITPSTVNGVALSGSSTPSLAVTGTSSISGANTGDQTITLTGDVTGSGTGSFAATIGSGKVTNAMLAGSIVASSKLSATGTPSSSTFLRGDDTWTAVTVPTAANPAASIGLSATNGSATTYMRSDAAPALDVTIAPTWSGAHTFARNSSAGAPTLHATGTWAASSTAPLMLIEPTGTTAFAGSSSGTGLAINAASGFGGNLIDAGVDHTSKFSVASTGVLNVAAVNSGNPGSIRFSNGASLGGLADGSGYMDFMASGGTVIFRTDGSSIGIRMGPNYLGFGNAHSGYSAALQYDGSSGVLAQKNDTTAQTLRIYGTTSGSKYLSLTHNGTNATITTSSGNLNLTAAGSVTVNGSALPSAVAIDTAAWVETAGNGGSDGTGIVGDPARPFATMAAAYTAGARTFYLGAGTHAGLSQTGALDVNIMGLGKTVTTITVIESTNEGAITVRDIGMQSCTITILGANASTTAAGAGGGKTSSVIIAENCSIGDVNDRGGHGGDDDTTNNAGPGGGVGGVTLTRCTVTGTVSAVGGDGGDTAEMANDGGVGAMGGIVTLNESTVAGVDATGGAGGDSGAGRTGAVGGIGGNIYANLTRITETLWLSGGAGGGGMTTGTAGNAGTLIAAHADVADLYSDNGGGEAQINGHHLYLATIFTGTPTITAKVSYINGTAY